MPSNTKQARIFISYSRRDQKWVERLRVHLKPLEKEYGVEVWDDSRIKPGSNWRAEIEEALKWTQVAILLLSPDFLASDFIEENELPPLLEAAAKNKTVILPVVLSQCRFSRVAGLSKFQTVNDPSKPLVKMTAANREAEFDKLSEMIDEILSSSEVSEEE